MPPVANFKEVDPELGALNLSKGGAYPVEYALHLGAGFGSQISMTLLRWVKTKDGVRRSPDALGYAYRIADPSRLERLAEPDRGSSDRRAGSGEPHAARARSRTAARVAAVAAAVAPGCGAGCNTASSATRAAYASCRRKAGANAAA